MLELFTDDGFIALVLDDPISLDEWYKEVNDEINNARNTLRPHADLARPNYAYHTHHQVNIKRISECTDHYGSKEIESASYKQKEFEAFIGVRWMCIEKDTIHIIRPVGSGDTKHNMVEMSVKHDNIIIFLSLIHI